MAYNEIGIEVPAGSDAFSPRADMAALASSLGGMVIVPVANATARTALLGALGWTPTDDRPLYVDRADGPIGHRLEVTVDGIAFTPVGGQELLTATTTGGTFGGGGGTLGIASSLTPPAVPYPRLIRIDFGAMATALASGHVEVTARRGATALRSARAASTNASATGTCIDTLAANVSATYQLVATTTAAATVTSNATLTYMTLTVSPV